MSSMGPRFREGTEGVAHFCLITHGVAAGGDPTARGWNHLEEPSFISPTVMRVIDQNG